MFFLRDGCFPRLFPRFGSGFLWYSEKSFDFIFEFCITVRFLKNKSFHWENRHAQGFNAALSSDGI